MLLPWGYIYVASKGAQIENYIGDNFVYGYKMTMCAISTKKCTYMGGGDVTHVYLQNKYGREDFQNITSAKLKKNNNDKNNIKMWRTVLRSYLSTDLLFY